MKKVLLPIIVILLIGGCSQSCKKSKESSDETKVEIAAENLDQLTLNVKGMTCEGCENAVVASINKLDGIQEATASHTEESTVVSFDPGKTDKEAISQAIMDAGYEVVADTEL